MNRNNEKDEMSLKMVSYWFSIPRIWRRSLFWAIMFILAITGWVKLLK